MQVHIDLPIFVAPTEAVGYFLGDIQVNHAPAKGLPFPWPSAWLVNFLEVFSSQSNQVWSIGDWQHGELRKHITMLGLVLNDREQAAAVVRHIEAVSGIQFWEHDLPDGVSTK